MLAVARDDLSRDFVVATTWGLRSVSPGGELRLHRDWHEVDAGVWQSEVWTLMVTWVDTRRPSQWTFADQETPLPEVLRERVQASVVLANRLDLGHRRSGQVAIRQDLSTRALLTQTILGPGVDPADPVVQERVQQALEDLEDQVGMRD